LHAVGSRLYLRNVDIISAVIPDTSCTYRESETLPAAAAAAATKSLCNYFRDCLILFPKDLQNLVCKKEREGQLKHLTRPL